MILILLTSRNDLSADGTGRQTYIFLSTGRCRASVAGNQNLASGCQGTGYLMSENIYLPCRLEPARSLVRQTRRCSRAADVSCPDSREMDIFLLSHNPWFEWASMSRLCRTYGY